jgi:hypothetical protein
MCQLVPLRRGDRFHTLVVDVSFYNKTYNLDASTSTSFSIFDSYAVLPRVGKGHGDGKWDLWLGNSLSEQDWTGRALSAVGVIKSPALVVVRDLGSLQQGGTSLIPSDVSVTPICAPQEGDSMTSLRASLPGVTKFAADLKLGTVALLQQVRALAGGVIMTVKIIRPNFEGTPVTLNLVEKGILGLEVEVEHRGMKMSGFGDKEVTEAAFADMGPGGGECFAMAMAPATPRYPSGRLVVAACREGNKLTRRVPASSPDVRSVGRVGTFHNVILHSKHSYSMDDSQYGPRNQSDTPWE